MDYTGETNEMRSNNGNLKPSEIKRYKAILLAKRSELLGNVSTMQHEALRRERSDLSNMPIHMADAGTDNYEIENTIGLMDSERKLLLQIHEALERIEDGVYGTCAGDGQAIPKQRLEAIPWAKFCVGCASLLEKGAMKQEDLFNKYDFASGIDDEGDEAETFGKGD
ncbi:MAG: TraR/DksA family transcriptional regulator [Planctomycetota bacterium]|jgi:RNA polymerase-binding protein DksA